MSFFKKIFSSSKKNDEKELGFPNVIMTDEYFEKRYLKYTIEEDIIEGAMKMVKGYFIDMHIKHANVPIYYPENLDKAINEGLGFHFYCRGLKLEDRDILFFLAVNFSRYMSEQYGFELYKDTETETPLRSMNLKFDKDGALITLYPLEYSLKVLNRTSTFTELENKVKPHLENLPSVKNVLDALNSIKK